VLCAAKRSVTTLASIKGFSIRAFSVNLDNSNNIAEVFEPLGMAFARLVNLERLRIAFGRGPNKFATTLEKEDMGTVRNWLKFLPLKILTIADLELEGESCLQWVLQPHKVSLRCSQLIHITLVGDDDNWMNMLTWIAENFQLDDFQSDTLIHKDQSTNSSDPDSDPKKHGYWEHQVFVGMDELLEGVQKLRVTRAFRLILGGEFGWNVDE